MFGSECINDMTHSVLNIGHSRPYRPRQDIPDQGDNRAWTDRHSESIKRNMTIKLGYADAVIRKCTTCEGSSAYTTLEKCPKDSTTDRASDEILNA